MDVLTVVSFQGCDLKSCMYIVSQFHAITVLVQQKNRITASQSQCLITGIPMRGPDDSMGDIAI